MIFLPLLVTLLSPSVADVERRTGVFTDTPPASQYMRFANPIARHPSIVQPTVADCAAPYGRDVEDW